MEILHKVIFSIAIAVAAIALIDFVLYSIKGGAKNATLSFLFWQAGFLGSIYVIYRLLP